jgi:hypothetical protein
VPQASVAVGAVWFAQVGTTGLHPKSEPGVQLVNAGGVVSSVHVQVLEQVEELAQPSTAVQVIVRERPHVLVLTIEPAEQVIVGVPQASVAVGAVWFAQVGTTGLHPKSEPGVQLVNAGGVVSSVQVHVAEQVEELPQASTAVQVIVRERPHVLGLVIEPAEQVTVGVPQASVAVGAVWFAQVGTVGLHPKSEP